MIDLELQHVLCDAMVAHEAATQAWRPLCDAYRAAEEQRQAAGKARIAAFNLPVYDKDTKNARARAMRAANKAYYEAHAAYLDASAQEAIAYETRYKAQQAVEAARDAIEAARNA